MQQSRVSSVLLCVAASGLVLAAYIAVLTHLPLDVFWHPDEGAKFIGLQMIDWRDGVAHPLPYSGQQLDPERRFYPATGSIYPTLKDDGSVEFRWPTFFLRLTRPAYDAFGIAGIYLLPLISGWLVATLAGLWTYLFRPRAAPAAILLAGLATPVAFYSVCFFEHTPATLLGGVALTILILRPGRASSLFLLAPFLAAAILLRIEMAAFAAALLASWGITVFARSRWQPAGLLRSRRSRWIVVPAAALVFGVLAFFLADAIPARHLALLGRIPYEIGRMWFKRDFFFDSVVRILLGEPGLTDLTQLRVWQVAALMALGGLIAAPFADTRAMELSLVLPALFVLLQTALLTVLHTLPFLQRQGVLAVSPFMGIALFAVPAAWRRRDARLLALASTGALYCAFGFLALYSTRVGEHDGSSLIGLDGAPRYMLMLYPIGSALAVFALADYRTSAAPALARSAFTVMVVSLMLVSTYYEFLGVRELADKRAVLVQWREEMRREEPPVTDLWWLPAVLAPYWLEHPIFVTKDAAALDAWLQRAASADLERFSYATTRPVPPALGADDSPYRESGTTSLLDLNVARFHRVSRIR